jgi:hypothetical protein
MYYCEQDDFQDIGASSKDLFGDDEEQLEDFEVEVEEEDSRPSVAPSQILTVEDRRAALQKLVAKHKTGVICTRHACIEATLMIPAGLLSRQFQKRNKRKRRNEIKKEWKIKSRSGLVETLIRKRRVRDQLKGQQMMKMYLQRSLMRSKRMTRTSSMMKVRQETSISLLKHTPNVIMTVAFTQIIPI